MCEGSAEGIRYVGMVRLSYGFYRGGVAFRGSIVPGHVCWRHRFLRLVPDRGGRAERGGRHCRKCAPGDAQAPLAFALYCRCDRGCAGRVARHSHSTLVHPESVWHRVSSDLSYDRCPGCLLSTIWNPIVQITHTHFKKDLCLQNSVFIILRLSTSSTCALALG